MRTRRVISSIIFLFILAGAFHQIKFSEIPVWKVPKLMASMRAKEFCSCYFMLGFEKDYCLKQVKKGYPIFDFNLDEKKQIVNFKNPLASSSAEVRSARLGCALK